MFFSRTPGATCLSMNTGLHISALSKVRPFTAPALAPVMQVSSVASKGARATQGSPINV